MTAAEALNREEAHKDEIKAQWARADIRKKELDVIKE